jgi:G3E family GTPase
MQHHSLDIKQVHTTRLDADNLLIPVRFLVESEEKSKEEKEKEKEHLIAPLFVHAQKYPKEVAKMIAAEKGEQTRGIGAYREMNWFFQGKKLIFWVTGSQKVLESVMEIKADLECIAVGQLKGLAVPMILKRQYVLAIAFGNRVELASLNSFSLDHDIANIRYYLDDALHIQTIKFMDQNKMIIVGDTGSLMVVNYAH